MARRRASSTAVDAHQALRRPSPRPSCRALLPVLAAVSLGGMVGSLGRYAVLVALPSAPGEFAWATFTVNVSGCLLIGVLMVLVETVWRGRGRGSRLVRPFLGVGVLGGFTTFSTSILDTIRTAADDPRSGLVYLAGTLLCALAAVWAGATLTRRLVTRRHEEPLLRQEQP